MSGFSAAWLALREPYDAAARAPGLVQRLGAWAQERRRLDIADLGSGTGAVLRFLAPQLPCEQRWRLVEHDPALVTEGARRLPPAPAWEYAETDLAAALPTVLQPRADLVTASALLDLVSAGWVDRLVAALLAGGSAFYAALTYDGRTIFAPPHPSDEQVTGLVARHQRRDKGFGPALGAAATAHVVERLTPLGGTLLVARSDWRLGRADTRMQRAMVEGMAAAARETEPERATAIAGWRRERLAAIAAAGGLTMTVGHRDLLWLPPPGEPPRPRRPSG